MTNPIFRAEGKRLDKKMGYKALDDAFGASAPCGVFEG